MAKENHIYFYLKQFMLLLFIIFFCEYCLWILRIEFLIFEQSVKFNKIIITYENEITVQLFYTSYKIFDDVYSSTFLHNFSIIIFIRKFVYFFVPESIFCLDTRQHFQRLNEFLGISRVPFMGVIQNDWKWANNMRTDLDWSGGLLNGFPESTMSSS